MTHPNPALTSFNVTFAPYGGSFYITSFNVLAASSPFKVGGILNENLIWILGCKTFPDPSALGKSLCPVIVNVGLQDLFNKDVRVFYETCLHPYKSPYYFIASFPLVNDIS